MKTKTSKPTQPVGTNWRLLGQLQLPVDFTADSTIQAWLNRTLGTLLLNDDLLGRITRSAEEALARAAESEHVKRDFQHLHLRVFSSDTTLAKSTSRETWGFFRIEKVGMSQPDADPMDHSIELYLYLEDRQPHRS